MKKPKNLWWIC